MLYEEMIVKYENAINEMANKNTTQERKDELFHTCRSLTRAIAEELVKINANNFTADKGVIQIDTQSEVQRQSGILGACIDIFHEYNITASEEDRYVVCLYPFVHKIEFYK